MTVQLLAVYVALVGTLMRSVLVKTHRTAPSCGHCGLPRERRELGEPICSCG
jgi:hypothetical protein